MIPAATCWSASATGTASVDGARVANASTMARIQPGTIAAVNQTARCRWSIRARTGGASSSGPQNTSAAATKHVCSRTWIHSLRGRGVVQLRHVPDGDHRRLHGERDRTGASRNAGAAPERRRPRASAPRDGAPRGAAGTAATCAATAGRARRAAARPSCRTTCCVMCTENDVSAQSSNGRSSTTKASATPL